MSEEINDQAPEALDQTQAPAPAAEPTQSPDLNVSDLAALRSIIEVATQRGAFKAAELEAVGKAFNKLNAFLEAVAKKET
jgi:hypothetical protein